jgi:hypothetical protein
MDKNLLKKGAWFVILLNMTIPSFSQKRDSTIVVGHFGGAVTVTNNGISFIPNFTLGKPAAIFDLSVGKGKLSFEPQFRFALEGKPWSFIFWWRYKLLNTGKFLISVGGHPSVTFKTKTFMVDGVPSETLVANRYLGGELSPSYLLAKYSSIGFNIFYGHGLGKDEIRNTYMISLRSSFSNIRLSHQLFMRFNPQFYFLKMADMDGVYFSSSFTLAKRNFPLSVSSVINKPIRTNIVGGKNFLWNISLSYTFNKEYVEK